MSAKQLIFQEDTVYTAHQFHFFKMCMRFEHFCHKKSKKYRGRNDDVLILEVFIIIYIRVYAFTRIHVYM